MHPPTTTTDLMTGGDQASDDCAPDRPPRRGTGALVRRTLVLGLVAPAVVLGVAAAAVAASPKVVAIRVAHYGTVIGNSSSRSLYVLSDEKGGHLHCKGGCLDVWFPLEVPAGHVPVGAGVKGHIGTVARGSHRQVTFNGYPVYTFAGDTGRAQSNGEKISSAGGTWYLARASATTAAGTPVK